MPNIELRDYQLSNAQKGYQVLRQYGLLYYRIEPRVGKTLTALETAKLINAKRVLFLTKLNAVNSIKTDYQKAGYEFELDVYNDEAFFDFTVKPDYRNRYDQTCIRSTVDIKDWDLLIYDEAHRLGSYAKPCVKARMLRSLFAHMPIILMSGTPSPESWSQLYYQFWISSKSPFWEQSFRVWAKTYVDVFQEVFKGRLVNNYDRAKEDLIEQVIAPYMVAYTQEESGFVCKIHEHLCPVEMPLVLKHIADCVMKDGVYQGRTGVLSADGPAAMLQKVHQLHSGTIILDEEEDGSRQSLTLSDAKAQYIACRWTTRKLVIFYCFKQEWAAIKQVLGDRVTDKVKEFQKPGNTQSIALQIVSGREGVNLSQGEAIIYFNFSHSAVSYWQSRDRLTTMERRESNLYMLFSQFNGEWGIERKIYDVVMDKRPYTLKHFKKDFPQCAKQKSKATTFSRLRQKATGH